MSVKGKRIGFIGCGNMGEALVKGLVEAHVVPADLITAFDTRGDQLAELDRRYGVRPSKSNVDVVRECDVVVLAVKPQIMTPVLAEIASSVSRRQLIVSIAAGVSTATIRAGAGKDVRLIRVMPNTPALVLQGATATDSASCRWA